MRIPSNPIESRMGQKNPEANFASGFGRHSISYVAPTLRMAGEHCMPIASPLYDAFVMSRPWFGRTMLASPTRALYAHCKPIVRRLRHVTTMVRPYLVPYYLLCCPGWAKFPSYSTVDENPTSVVVCTTTTRGNTSHPSPHYRTMHWTSSFHPCCLPAV